MATATVRQSLTHRTHPELEPGRMYGVVTAPLVSDVGTKINMRGALVFGNVE